MTTDRIGDSFREWHIKEVGYDPFYMSARDELAMYVQAESEWKAYQAGHTALLSRLNVEKVAAFIRTQCTQDDHYPEDTAYTWPMVSPDHLATAIIQHLAEEN